MQTRKKPPGRMSDSYDVTVNPRGAPCQCCRCWVSVQHSKTSSRGASNRRVITNSVSLAFAWLAGMFLVLLGLFGFQFREVNIQTIEAFFPESAIRLHPVGDVLERTRLQPARPPLGFP